MPFTDISCALAPRRLGGVIVPLALLGGALTSTSALATDTQPVIATVNGHPIMEAEVEAQINAMPLGEQVAVRAQRARFAETLVREEVVFQWALSDGFESEPELREEIKARVIEHLIERHVRSRIAVTDAQIKEYYEKNASIVRGEGVRASQILLEDFDECESLQASIDSEAEFARIARERSLHRASAPAGGDLGMFMNHGGPYGFETALFYMQPGDMAVFESEEGCHLVRVTEREVPPLPPIADVADGIRGLLERRQERELFREFFERAAQNVEVVRPSTR